MKAIIEGIYVEDVTILGKWEGLGLMVDWSCPAKNVKPLDLLKVQQAGFTFHIKGDTCYITSRRPYTQFVEE